MSVMGVGGQGSPVPRLEVELPDGLFGHGLWVPKWRKVCVPSSFTSFPPRRCEGNEGNAIPECDSVHQHSGVHRRSRGSRGSWKEPAGAPGGAWLSEAL